MMGKALSGELSCPCDRSCYASLLNRGQLFTKKKKKMKNLLPQEQILFLKRRLHLEGLLRGGNRKA